MCAMQTQRNDRETAPNKDLRRTPFSSKTRQDKTRLSDPATAPLYSFVGNPSGLSLSHPTVQDIHTQ
jgi:hypothetical protein